MAMRLFSPDDFELELVKAGLKKTDTTSNTTRVWMAPNGETITVPVLPAYWEWMLDALLIKLNLLYRPWDQN